MRFRIILALFFESFFQDVRIGLQRLHSASAGDNSVHDRERPRPPRLFLPASGAAHGGRTGRPAGRRKQNNNGAGNIPSSQDYLDLRAAQKSFSMMAAYLNGSTINVTYKGTPQRYTGGYVTDDFFKIIHVAPILGRDFTAADNKPGAEKTALLGYEIWKRDFGGDPKIVGEATHINSRAATVVGAYGHCGPLLACEARCNGRTALLLRSNVAQRPRHNAILSPTG